MDKKAFTLVEIMGVIIIIGIITLITTPIVSYIIEEMRVGAFRSSLHSVFRTTEYYYKQNSFEEFPSMGLEVTSEKVELKNKKFVSGRIIKDKEGNLYLKNVTDNRYCGNGIITSLRITKGDCSDLTIPENLSITVLEEGINKIKVSGYYEEDGYIRKIEFGIREKGNIEYTWHESTKDGIPHDIYEFTGLKKNTEYEIGLRVTNENDLSAEAYTEGKTLNIESPYITYKKEWERSKEVSINIPNVESSLKYSYIIVSAGGQIEEIEIKQSDINNHIYKVIINKEDQTMIIKVIDESNSSNNYTSIGEVIGYIDVTKPTIEITSISTPTGSNNWYINSPVITITKSDNKSGLKSYEYAVSTDGGSTYSGITVVEDLLNIATLTINTNGSNIKVRIRAIDKVGNTSEYVYTDALKIDTGSITAPVITPSDSIASNNWHTANFTLTFSGSSSVSGITYYYGTSTSSMTNVGTTASITTETSGTTYYVKACNAANKCSSNSTYIVKLDKSTPNVPTITPSDGIASNNWHIANFTLTFSGSSSVSGVTYYYGTSTSSMTNVGTTTSITAETSGTTYYVKACNGVGRCSGNGSYIVKLDKSNLSIPTITASDGKASNTWHNTNFTLTFSGNSSSSGITYYYGTNVNSMTNTGNTVSVNAETASLTYYVKACNGLGRCSGNASYVVKLDKTPPQRGNFMYSGTEGQMGWYRSVVSVNYYNSIDLLSGVCETYLSQTLFTAPILSTSTARVTDCAGNYITDTSKAVGVDTWSPTIISTSPSSYTTLRIGQFVSFSCSAMDSGGSGLKSCTASPSSSYIFSTSPIFVLFTATDYAGNTSTTNTIYQVNP